MNTKILITGANGQLATCIKDIEAKFDSSTLIYTDYHDLDITNFQNLRNYFKEHSVQWCVNCAAYTAVDQSETDQENAARINVFGAENLAKVCKELRVKLIHISTDFVFDGKTSVPYNEEDQTHPLGVYGLTKLEGEFAVQKNVFEHFILRTSWLYSEHGNNFMKTMLKLASTHSEIKVIADQIGTPTYAADLAEVIREIINSNSEEYGLYHFSNEGVASWYDFAVAIFDIAEINVTVKPIATSEYPTPAKRPSYSVMDKKKIKETFNFGIPYWRNSLKEAIKKNQ